MPILRVPTNCQMPAPINWLTKSATRRRHHSQAQKLSIKLSVRRCSMSFNKHDFFGISPCMYSPSIWSIVASNITLTRSLEIWKKAKNLDRRSRIAEHQTKQETHPSESASNYGECDGEIATPLERVAVVHILVRSKCWPPLPIKAHLYPQYITLIQTY